MKKALPFLITICVILVTSIMVYRLHTANAKLIKATKELNAITLKLEKQTTDQISHVISRNRNLPLQTTDQISHVISRNRNLPLRTKNCIHCGKPAEVWTGHVLDHSSGTKIIAGHTRYCYEEFRKELRFHGYYGPWKPEYGVERMKFE